MELELLDDRLHVQVPFNLDLASLRTHLRDEEHVGVFKDLASRADLPFVLLLVVLDDVFHVLRDDFEDLLVRAALFEPSH